MLRRYMELWIIISNPNHAILKIDNHSYVKTRILNLGLSSTENLDCIVQHSNYQVYIKKVICLVSENPSLNG